VQAEHRETYAKLEAMWVSFSQVWDFMLGRPARTSSLAVSLSSVIELIYDHVDAAVANRVRRGPDCR
jgi:hypothetical protein